MNKLFCSHEVRYIKKRKGKTLGHRKLSKMLVTEDDEVSYANDFKKNGPISFVIAEPHSIEKSDEFPDMRFYHWNLNTM